MSLDTSKKIKSVTYNGVEIPLASEEISLQEKSVSPSTSSQTVTPDTNYDGLSKVTVSAVTSSIDSDIKASNIKSGINILGVTGTLVEGITPSGTMNITSNGTYDVTNYANASVTVTSSGGSGGGVETGELKLIIGNNLGSKGSIKVYYTDENMMPQIVSSSKHYPAYESITCVLNTPILIETYFGISEPDFKFIASGVDYFEPIHESDPYSVYDSLGGLGSFLVPIYLTSKSGSFTMELYE